MVVSAVKPVPFGSGCSIRLWLKLFVADGGRKLGVKVEKLSADVLGLGWVSGLLVKMAARELRLFCGVSADGMRC